MQHEPLDGQPASERTEVRIPFDDAAWVFDREPAAIVRSVPGTVFGTWMPRDRTFIVKLTRQVNLVR
ncbi:MAG TPA: hypothetical protein VNL18_13985 [Gemmatimonadales bacterium]|nr:hypothetical protein [Gemmatimonadales bacterium]